MMIEMTIMIVIIIKHQQQSIYCNLSKNHGTVRLEGINKGPLSPGVCECESQVYCPAPDKKRCLRYD